MPISQKAHEILNRPDLIARRDLWINRLKNVYTPEADSWNQRYVYGVFGINGVGKHDPYTEPELWVEDCLEDLAARYEVMENESYFRPLCVQLPFYGVHYIDKILGAEVFYQYDQWYNHYLPGPIGTLQAPDLSRDPVWDLTKRAIQAFLDADVALPFLNLPAFASALNNAVNLYGGEILMEMMEDPDNARADLTVINDLICQLHAYCRDTVPAKQLQMVCSDGRMQPPGYGQLCGCSTQLLSASLYADLIAPLDDKLLSGYPNGGMIHLCGSHTQHLETFRNMKSLKSVQINDRASEDLQAYFDGLREDQIIYFLPCDEMPLEKGMEITGGKRLVIPAAMGFEKPLLKR